MLRLYNEQSGRLEQFDPLGDVVTLYVCGITPYDTTHLGHAFTYLSFDVLVRYWEYKGYRVRYAQNVTDIDDDILRKSGETGQNWLVLGNRWVAHYIRDMRDLNVRPPDYFPRATDAIPQMLDQIQVLLDKGHAYIAEGNIYYEVASAPAFGHVSRLPEDEWLPTANERGNFPDAPGKRHSLDFVLWQAQKPGEPAWNSPWGKGRPGWHIECSSLAAAYLGDEIDVHGGGGDLAFPHHECETAQMCGVSGKERFARFWMHTAMVRYQGEKMSKSLGNLIWVRDLLARHAPDAVRILVNSHPYHETWEYDASELLPADEMAERLRLAAQVRGGAGPVLASDQVVCAFEESLDDNLNTRGALQALDRLAAEILAAADAGRSVQAAQATLARLGKVFGLRFGGTANGWVQAGWGQHMQRFQ